MMEPVSILALLSRWFFGGGWKWVAGAVVIGGLTIWGVSWLNHYHDLQDKAARTEKAEGQIKDFTTRLDKAVAAKAAADKERDKARAQLAQADADRATYFNMLKEGLKNAAVRTNPVCWPTDADRRVRNEAPGRFIPGFGTVGAGGGLPAAPQGGN